MYDVFVKPTHQLEAIYHAYSIVSDLNDLSSFSSERCALSRFVGNEKAKKRLGRFVYEALQKPNRSVSKKIALIGPPSVGKTRLAKLFGESLAGDGLQFPFVEIHPKSIKSPIEILGYITDALSKFKIKYNCNVPKTAIPPCPIEIHETSLELVPDENNHFEIPSCVIFIDEVHALGMNIVEALLKPTESNDGMLSVSASNGGTWTADFKKVTWIIATTERGLLFDAFDSRFDKIKLHPYSQSEIAKIVKMNIENLDIQACELAAKFGGRVPRESIEFARDMLSEKNRNPNKSWEEIALLIADEHDIDEYGLSYQRIEVLKALGKGPIAKNRLISFAECKQEELEKFVLPPLFSKPALIGVCNKGYYITLDGLKELDKRNIENNGTLALPEIILNRS